jgi:hypothetical protein
MHPPNFGIALKPRHLLAGIDAGVLFDFFDGKIKCPFAIQIFENFFVTNSV